LRPIASKMQEQELSFGVLGTFSYWSEYTKSKTITNREDLMIVLLAHFQL